MSTTSTYALTWSYPKYSNEHRKKETKLKSKHTHITRRKASSLFLHICSPIQFHAQSASATESSFLDMFRMTVPDQTVEEAENGIKEHAMSLVQVKQLLELESWKEAQKELRKSASYLKQDIYTIIQAKPAMERAQLRNLYSKLFNGVTGLDYAARDSDVPRVWNLYEDVVATLDDILSRDQGDMNTVWLSIFVEDCLSSSGSCIPPLITPLNPQSTTPNAQVTTTPSSKPEVEHKPHITNNLSTHKLVVPSKARSKRKRTQLKSTSHSCWSQEYSVFNKDPLLLHQAYWLADSELLVPKSTSEKKHEEKDLGSVQVRRCSHCQSQRTPQWRAGPEGPKTLCNACGVRYKSSRLLPEYRPAKSPSFVSYKHSNSHKKVLEMRMYSSSS